MIVKFDREEQNKYKRISWNVLRFLLINRNHPKSNEYKCLTKELFSLFSQVLNLNSINEPNEFILNLSYEFEDNKQEISFDDVDRYKSEFAIKKQILIEALNLIKTDNSLTLK